MSFSGPLLSRLSVSVVGLELPVDDIGDPSFQCPDCFFGGFAFGDLFVVVGAALAGVAELGDCGDVEYVVEFAVSSWVEPMPVLVP